MIKLALAYVPQNARVLLAFIVLGSCVEADEILLCQWQGRNFWCLGVFSVQFSLFSDSTAGDIESNIEILRMCQFGWGL